MQTTDRIGGMRRPSIGHVLFATQVIGISLLIVVLGFFAIYAADWNGSSGVGTIWIYEASQTSGANFIETQTIAGLEMCGFRVCLVYTTESGKARTIQWITRDWILIRAMHIDEEGNTQDVVYENGLRIYKIPLRVGDSWTWDTTATRTVTIKETERGAALVRKEEFTVYALRKVVDVERVRVPAGEYSAFVIEHFDQHDVIRQKLWFSNDAGEAVKYVGGFFSIYRTLWELREHKPQQASLLEFFELSFAMLKPLPLLIAGLVLSASSWTYKKLRTR